MSPRWPFNIKSNHILVVTHASGYVTPSTKINGPYLRDNSTRQET